MRISMKRQLTSAVAGVALAAAAGMAAQAQDQQSVTFSATPSGTSQYLWAVQHMQAVAEQTGYDVIVQESSGSEENMFRLDKQKTTDLGVIDASAIEERWGDDHDIRTFANYAPVVWQIFVAEDAGVETLADLEGKPFNPGPTGGGSTRVTMAILEDMGIQPEYFEGTLDDALAAFMDRRVVGLSYRGTGANPTGGVVEAGASRDITFVPFTDEDIAAAKEQFPYLTEAYIEAGTYPGQDEPVQTIGTWQAGQIGVHKDVPEEVVYNLAKAYFETLPDVAETHLTLARVTAENSVSEASIPLHPGAIRYYREQGIEIPEDVIPPEAK